MEKSLYSILNESDIDLKSWTEKMLKQLETLLGYNKVINKCLDYTNYTNYLYVTSILFDNRDVYGEIKKFETMLSTMNNICSRTFYVDNNKISFHQIESVKVNLNDLYVLFSQNDTIISSCYKVHTFLLFLIQNKNLYLINDFSTFLLLEKEIDQLHNQIPDLTVKLSILNE